MNEPNTPTPRTYAAINAPIDGPEGLELVKRLSTLCATLEHENRALLARATAAEPEWQAQAALVKAAVQRETFFRNERDACHAQFKRIHETLPARQGGYSGAECVDAFFAVRSERDALAAQVVQLTKENDTANEQRAKDINENANLMTQVSAWRAAAEREIKYQLLGDSLLRKLLDRVIDSGERVEFDVWHSERPTAGSLSELLATTPATASAEQFFAGFDAAVSKVNHWLAGHKSRAKTFPNAACIECEIKDITELLGALAAQRAARQPAPQEDKAK